MSKRKLTDAQVEDLMRDYYAWEKYNPESETAEELAARHNISKQTLYKEKRDYERKHGYDRRLQIVPPPQPTENGSFGGLEDVVRYLTAELVSAKVKIRELEERLDDAAEEREVLQDKVAALETKKNPSRRSGRGPSGMGVAAAALGLMASAPVVTEAVGHVEAAAVEVEEER